MRGWSWILHSYCQMMRWAKFCILFHFYTKCKTSVSSEGTPESSPGPPELSSGPPEPSPGPPELSPGSPELSPGPPQPSPGPPELRPGPPELSPGPPELSPGPSELSPGLVAQTLIKPIIVNTNVCTTKARYESGTMTLSAMIHKRGRGTQRRHFCHKTL